jgi:hypothetical protein
MTFTPRAGRIPAALYLATTAIVALAPGAALACACGCGVFDVGDGTIMSNSTSDASVWIRYSYMDQNQNWEGGAKAPAGDNQDKKIVTNFYTVGGQYRISPAWTIMAELPIYQRALTTTDDGTVFTAAGSVYTGHDTAQGDLQLMATYTGFWSSPNTGLTFGVKLPTGDFTGPKGPLGGLEFDRDSLPGTGSTDVMLGGYHAGQIGGATSRWSYFVQARYQLAVAERDSYRPGNEFDSAAGVTYDLGSFGAVTRVAPVLQVLNSHRDHDSGTQADYLNSGYERLLLAPGVEVRFNHVRLYADVAIPLYQHTNAAANLAIEGTSGQLVAPELFKVQAAYDF